jgi:hypothetical protein
MATSELDERRVRAAKNESLFRAVNERIEDISEAFDLSKRAIDFVCECADPNCSAVIELTHEEYESIRRAPTHFAIKPGHEMLEIEQVMAGNARYLVVSKLGAAGQTANELDPRTAQGGPPG